MPHFEPRPFQQVYDQLELLGFPLENPFTLLAEKWQTYGSCAKQIVEQPGRQAEIIGYLVTTKTTATRQGEKMHFGTFLDRDGQYFDTVHFPEIAKKYPFRGKGFYLISGTVEVEYNCPQLTVSHQKRLSYKHEDEPASIRSFRAHT